MVERHEDHPTAAAQLGCNAPKGVTDEAALIDSAIDFLMENTGEDFKAPKHVVAFFKNADS